MSLVPTSMTTSTHTSTRYTLVGTFVEPTPTATTYTIDSSLHPTDHVDVVVYIWVQVPLTCKNIHDYALNEEPLQIEDAKPNPDIAGIGILLAFYATACSVVCLALVAYMGGFLPAHFLRRVDRRVFQANSRHERSRLRTVIENVMMSLSDQQLVTGLAILVAGYYEMMNSDLALYHWQVVTYLAWLSSSVHIASLTLLRDALNRNPVLRNVRVAGMMILLTLLMIAFWPIRFGAYQSSMPAKCLWTSTYSTPQAGIMALDMNWIITIIMLLFAYAWKLSQLFASCRGLVRRWLVAIPEAAIERVMRRVVRSHRSKWLRWPAYKMLIICYISFVAWAEFAESFVASLVYLCLTFPYGVAAIMNVRWGAEDYIIAGERRLTFGQLVPLFLLVIPVLLVLELSTVSDTKKERPETIYSLMAGELHRPRENTYSDLTSALRLNEPSKSDDKLKNDCTGSYDPIVDHLMRSRAFKTVVWTLFVGLVTIGFTIVLLSLVMQGLEMRFEILAFGGAPALAVCVPLMAVVVLPCSRRLR